MAKGRERGPFDEVAAAEEEEAMRMLRERLHALYDPVLDEPIPPALLQILKKFGGQR